MKRARGCVRDSFSTSSLEHTVMFPSLGHGTCTDDGGVPLADARRCISPYAHSIHWRTISPASADRSEGKTMHFGIFFCTTI